MNKWIFLCYRRKDSSVQAGRIFDALNARFPGEVFRDVESIDIGANWIEELRQSVLFAEALVVVIGPEWQAMANERGPRINDPADYVHIELQTALEHDIRIIPLLLDGAQMPPPRTLPPKLEGLLRRQALPLRDDRFDEDLSRLTAGLERVRAEVERVHDQIARQATAREHQELSARRLAAYAEATAVKRRALTRAGLLALESMLRMPLPGAHSVLRQVRAGLPRVEGELAHAAQVTAIAESTGGAWIATGAADGVVKVWDAATLTPLLQRQTGGKVEALEFGGKEPWLAASSADSKIAVWEVPTGTTLAGFDTAEPVIKLLVQSDASGTSLVALSRETSHGHLYMCSSTDWSLHRWPMFMVRDVAGQQQQKLIAVAWGDHLVLVNTQSGELLARFPLEATAMAVAWHQSYQLFAATTMEGVLWRGFLAQTSPDTVEWRCERVNGNFSQSSPLTFSPTAAWLAVADNSGLAVLDMENFNTLPLPLQGQFEFDFEFSGNGRQLAVVSPEGHAISVWQLPERLLIIDLAVEDALVARFGTAERRLITASHDNAARVWELPSGETTLWTRGLGATHAFTFSPRGDMLAWWGMEVAPNHRVRGNETTLVVLRSADGGVVFSTKHEGLIDAVAFDAGSRWVAFRSGHQTRVFSVPAGQEETPAMATSAEAWFPQSVPASSLPESLAERDTVQSLQSTNGSWLVTLHPGRVRVWDRTTMTELTAFPIATDTTGIALSPDDRYLAIGGGDGDLQIRTMPGGDEIAVLPHDGAVTKFAFSPDGNFIVSAGVDAFVILMWLVSPEILMDDVRQRLDRDLSENEWKLYVGNEPYAETRASASTRLRTVATQRAG